MICTLHNVDMGEQKTGRFGPYFSHSTDDLRYVSQKGWCYGKPPKSESAAPAPAQAPLPQQAISQPVNNGYKSKDESWKIQRQHSQEMALRFLEWRAKTSTMPDLDKEMALMVVKELTDWFMKDLEGNSGSV